MFHGPLQQAQISVAPSMTRTPPAPVSADVKAARSFNIGPTLGSDVINNFFWETFFPRLWSAACVPVHLRTVPLQLGGG